MHSVLEHFSWHHLVYRSGPQWTDSGIILQHDTTNSSINLRNQTESTRLGWIKSFKGSSKLGWIWYFDFFCVCALALKPVGEWQRHRFGLKIFPILVLFSPRALILLDFNRRCNGLLTFLIILGSQQFLRLLLVYCICLHLAKAFSLPFSYLDIDFGFFKKKEGYKQDWVPKLSWNTIRHLWMMFAAAVLSEIIRKKKYHFNQRFKT